MNDEKFILYHRSVGKFLEEWESECSPARTFDINKAMKFDTEQFAMAFLLNRTYEAGASHGDYNSGLVVRKIRMVPNPAWEMVND